ncbi:Leucine--tRNA ligase, cytoplasmic [Picochlorum sp. SENEW3]|nr:Leucine--tRNA ligase, cytoplasmic [Picochlorum sp. SENEW3]WPT18471.1 Leucine--tRNA ligase, cytoplasmic [Picochlorum sp. SENEW3]
MTNSTAAAESGSGGSFAKRDLLLELQEESQRTWSENNVFECDAPMEGMGTADEKFFGNFPYPYMNGLLHLGHAFSLSKLEFAAAYHRLCGKNVLFPQGFHCTGMPIKACADKLAREIKTYGCPPVFPEEDAEMSEAEADTAKVDPTKFVAKKSKALAKKGKGASQWEILKMSGIPEDEIPKFADPLYWLEFFPPLAMRDIKAMGCGVDWRRSFITTDMNPFYDSFVKWQFHTLLKAGKVVKDKRYAVFSPIDGQPCADHDRATGEGVGPQEYTLIKMKVLEFNEALSKLDGSDTYLLAATLRPETMCGQTNCWALPDGDYGVYKGLNNEYYVMSERSALNLSYQDRMPETGKPELVLSIKGSDLFGLPLSSPSCFYEKIYVLPLMTILTNKGTGIVTSVPSDAPDDFAALEDLKNKPKLREKFGIKDEWVLPYDVVEIIDIPELGTAAAAKVCKDMKIQSQNDTKKLAEAKQLVYLKGFTDGIMNVGPYKGRKVSEVKPIIKEEMIQANQAILYNEPERQVMSRSGGECVVALTDQWYLTYGEQEWKEATQRCLANMETFDLAARHQFEHTLDWLNQWACSRSFGLGTRLPWDPEFLIESLSDSTIYMAYYTVAHILQAGDMYCKKEGAAPGGIKAEDMTPEVWDAIFLGADIPDSTPVPKELIQKMMREFNYWYPFDLRVSGKDLIQNHLTFCLYTHTSIWSEREDLWPQGMRTNGHLLLNAEKMSKSTGNFKTLGQAIREYSADAMRIALADAGDTMDDANFEHQTANGAILRLTKELTWIEEVLNSVDAMRNEQPTSFLDRVFDNEMNICLQKTKESYDHYLFREALKFGMYDLQIARDTYRFACGPEGMNRRLILKYIDLFARGMTPIVPHTAEHIWRNLLKKDGFIIKAGWPKQEPIDLILQSMATYIESTIAHLRKSIIRAEQPPKARKGEPAAPPPSPVCALELVVPSEYGGWQAKALDILKGIFEEHTAAGSPNGKKFPDGLMGLIMSKVRQDKEFLDMGQKAIKATIMPFFKTKADNAEITGIQSLDIKLPFDEFAILTENAKYLERSLKLDSISVRSITYEQQQHENDLIKSAAPGSPAALFTHS